MGAGIVLFFWLFLAGIYGVVFLAFAGLWFWGRKKKLKWLKWLAGIPALGMALLAVLVVSIITYRILDLRNPRTVFKAQFGIAPPASVSGIKSSYYCFADTEDIYLRFKTTDLEFGKLVPARLQKKTPEEMERDTPGVSGSEVPAWWDYQIGEDWIYYLRIGSGGNGANQRRSASESEYFAYNPKTHIAYYRLIGVD